MIRAPRSKRWAKCGCSLADCGPVHECPGCLYLFCEQHTYQREERVSRGSIGVKYVMSKRRCKICFRSAFPGDRRFDVDLPRLQPTPPKSDEPGWRTYAWMWLAMLVLGG